MQAGWLDLFLAAELLFYEFVVVEIFVGQIESAGVRLVGPTGVFIRTAFGADAGIAWQVGAAVGTRIGGCFQIGSKSESFSSTDTGVFFVHSQIKAHQNIIVGNGLHVFDIIGQAEKRAETEHRECL